MIVLTVILLLLIIGLIVLFNQWNRNRMPSKRQRARVLQEIKQNMDEWSAPLVDIGREELDLFSLGQEKQVVKTGAGTTAKGTFTTIFHEPVVSYTYRRFLGKKNNELLYARTADHEYTFWTEGGRTSLDIDGRPVGKLDAGVLYGQRSGKPLARIAERAQDGGEYLPVSVGDREVGSLTTRRGSADDPLSQRAFEFVPGDLNEKEEQLLLSLATREMVLRSLPG